MTESTEYITVSFEHAKVRINEKCNRQGKVRKMKLNIDLNKAESEGFKSFIDSVKPPNVSLDNFVKMLLLLGVKNIQQEAATKWKEFQELNPEEAKRMVEEAQKEQPGNIEIVQ